MVLCSYLEFPKREFPRSGIAGIPIGIPGSKTALYWEFPRITIQRGFYAYRLEFPYRGGSMHTEGVLLHTEGGVLVASGEIGFYSFVLEYR